MLVKHQFPKPRANLGVRGGVQAIQALGGLQGARPRPALGQRPHVAVFEHQPAPAPPVAAAGAVPAAQPGKDHEDKIAQLKKFKYAAIAVYGVSMVTHIAIAVSMSVSTKYWDLAFEYYIAPGLVFAANILSLAWCGSCDISKEFTRLKITMTLMVSEISLVLLVVALKAQVWWCPILYVGALLGIIFLSMFGWNPEWSTPQAQNQVQAGGNLKVVVVQGRQAQPQPAIAAAAPAPAKPEAPKSDQEFFDQKVRELARTLKVTDQERIDGLNAFI